MERSQTNTIQLKNVKCVSLQNCCSGYEDLQNAKRYSSYAHKIFEWKAFAVGSIIAKTSNVSPLKSFAVFGTQEFAQTSDHLSLASENLLVWQSRKYTVSIC